MSTVTRRALATVFAVALTVFAAAGFAACGGSTDPNLRACALVQQAVAQLAKKHQDPKAVQKTITETVQVARHANDAALRRAARRLPASPSAGASKTAGPVDFTNAAVLAELTKHCRTSKSPFAPKSGGKAASLPAHGAGGASA